MAEPALIDPALAHPSLMVWALLELLLSISNKAKSCRGLTSRPHHARGANHHMPVHALVALLTKTFLSEVLAGRDLLFLVHMKVLTCIPLLALPV